jgi:hypothetical protein
MRGIEVGSRQKQGLLDTLKGDFQALAPQFASGNRGRRVAPLCDIVWLLYRGATG